MLKRNDIMIDAKELRIGNYYICADDNEVVSVGDAYSLSLIEKYNNASPIPLTEEILLDCGFFKYNNAYVLEVPKESVYDFDFSIWNDFTYNSAEFPIELKSLHQLQNLYFALTNKELTYAQKNR